MDRANLIPLCMGILECHLRIGHGGDWQWHNRYVARDVAWVQQEPDAREQVEAQIRARCERAETHRGKTKQREAQSVAGQAPR